jgi:hypothetical protein
MVGQFFAVLMLFSATVAPPGEKSLSCNLRDLSSQTRATDGTVSIWPGLVFRTAQTALAKQEKMSTWVHSVGLRTFYDFRTEDEIARDGPPDVLLRSGVHWVRLPTSTSIAALRRHPIPTASDWSNFYLKLFEENTSSFVRLIEGLSCKPLPAAFGCTFGKDRTGVAAALVLSCLGASEEAIALDYAASTNELYVHRNRMVGWGLSWGLTEEEATQATLVAQPRTILFFLKSLKERYGSVEKALEENGLKPTTLLKLRQRMRNQGE